MQKGGDTLSKGQSLVKRYGKLPAGMSRAEVDVVLDFLYGAFDKRAAKQVRIVHPYWDEATGNTPPELTVEECSRWLQAAAEYAETYQDRPSLKAHSA